MDLFERAILTFTLFKRSLLFFLKENSEIKMSNEELDSFCFSDGDCFKAGKCHKNAQCICDMGHYGERCSTDFTDYYPDVFSFPSSTFLPKASLGIRIVLAIFYVMVAITSFCVLWSKISKVAHHRQPTMTKTDEIDC